MNTEATLAEAIRVFRAIQEPRWTGRAVRGRLADASALATELRHLEDAGALEIEYDGRRITLTEFQRMQAGGDLTAPVVQMTPPDSQDAFFAKDLAELLSDPTFRYRRPSSFFLARENLEYAGGSGSGVVAAYFEVLEFVAFLRQLADHEDSRNGELWLVFLTGAEKVAFPIAYGEPDITAVSDTTGLSLEVLEAPHALEKRHLFRGALLELSAHAEADTRLRAVLARFSEIRKRFEDNLALYLSEFSFETERERLASVAREYMLKINAALGDVHAKLIAIPAAVVLVAGQLKLGQSATELIFNAVLLLGAAVAGVLMVMLTANQRHSLEAIRGEYRDREQRLEREMPHLYEEVGDAFRKLEARYRHQLRLIRLINALVIGGLLISFAVFVAYLLLKPQTPPLRAIFRFVA